MKMNKCEIRNVVRKQNKKGQIVPVVNEDGEDKKKGGLSFSNQVCHVINLKICVGIVYSCSLKFTNRI